MVMFCWLPCQGSCEFSVHQWNILDLSTQQEDRWILMRRFIQSPLALLGCAKLLQSCPTLCNGMDRNLSDSSPMEFSRHEYGIELLCLPPGDLPDPGIEPVSLMFPALAGRFFPSHLGNPAAVLADKFSQNIRGLPLPHYWERLK